MRGANWKVLRDGRAGRRPVKAGSGPAVIAGVAVVGALVLSSCSSGTASDGGGGTSGGHLDATGATKRGGSVTMLVTGLSARFDPVSAFAFGFVSNSPMNAIFGLLTYNDTATNSIKMGFLKSLSHDSTYKVWTAKLPPGLKFSDGTPFDAAAIAFNLKRAADSSTGSLFVKDAQAITPEVVDPTTLKMTLKSPNVHFDAVLTEDFAYVGSSTAIQKDGDKFGTSPVGAGPFKVKSIDGTNSMVLEPNPNFALFAPDQPRLDSVTFQFLGDFSKEAQAMAANQAQLAPPYGGDAIKQFTTLPNVTVATTHLGAGSNIQMSFKRPPFNDPRAREAIFLALDRGPIANAFQPGTAAQTNLFSPDSPYYDSKYNYPPPNKQRAQQLFDQLAAEGKPVKFTYTTTDQTPALNTAQVVQSQLSAFKNVKVTIRSETTAEYITDQHSGNYQMIPNGLYLVNPIPELQNYFVTGGSLNTMGYSNPKVDAAINDLLTQTDKQKQLEDYGIIQQQTTADHAVYWVGQGLLTLAANKDLAGIVPVNYGNAPLWGPLGYKA